MKTHELPIHLTMIFRSPGALKQFIDWMQAKIAGTAPLKMDRVSERELELHIRMPDRSEGAPRYMHSHETFISFLRQAVKAYKGKVTHVIDSTVQNTGEPCCTGSAISPIENPDPAIQARKRAYKRNMRFPDRRRDMTGNMTGQWPAFAFEHSISGFKNHFTEGANKARQSVLRKGKKSEKEHSVIVNHEGDVIHRFDGSKGRVHLSVPGAIDKKNKYAIIHNHPSNSKRAGGTFSTQDIQVFVGWPGVRSIEAVNHKGVSHLAKPGPNYPQDSEKIAKLITKLYKKHLKPIATEMWKKDPHASPSVVHLLIHDKVMQELHKMGIIHYKVVEPPGLRYAASLTPISMDFDVSVAGSTLTKRALYLAISEELGFAQARTRPVVSAVLDKIALALLNGQRVELRNFGIFEMRRRKSAWKKNPRTKDDVFKPETFYVHFRPSKKIHEMRDVGRPFNYGGMRGMSMVDAMMALYDEKQMMRRNYPSGVNGNGVVIPPMQMPAQQQSAYRPNSSEPTEPGAKDRNSG